MDVKKLNNFFDSKEGKKSIEEFSKKLINDEKILNYQLKKFHERCESDSKYFDNFIEKVINKYNSKKYTNYWYKKGYESPEDLYWFLFEYAEKYGRECNKIEWEKYGNEFTSELYFINDYYFNKMDGQGSIIKIIKK